MNHVKIIAQNKYIFTTNIHRFIIWLDEVRADAADLQRQWADMEDDPERQLSPTREDVQNAAKEPIIQVMARSAHIALSR